MFTSQWVWTLDGKKESQHGLQDGLLDSRRVCGMSLIHAQHPASSAIRTGSTIEGCHQEVGSTELRHHVSAVGPKEPHVVLGCGLQLPLYVTHMTKPELLVTRATPAGLAPCQE